MGHVYPQEKGAERRGGESAGRTGDGRLKGHFGYGGMKRDRCVKGGER